MAKIPFNIKYRPQIESGEYKVVTENDDEPARIICWDSPINKERPIIAIVFDDQIEQYKADGRYDNDYDTSNYDLFIVTPEPKPSKFTLALRNAMADTIALAEGKGDDETSEIADKQAKRYAAELLAIARKEALKDLPRWSTNSDPNFKPGKYFCVANALISPQGWSILFKDLEKLPGFTGENDNVEPK